MTYESFVRLIAYGKSLVGTGSQKLGWEVDEPVIPAALLLLDCFCIQTDCNVSQFAVLITVDSKDTRHMSIRLNFRREGRIKEDPNLGFIRALSHYAKSANSVLIGLTRFLGRAKPRISD